LIARPGRKSGKKRTQSRNDAKTAEEEWGCKQTSFRRRKIPVSCVNSLIVHRLRIGSVSIMTNRRRPAKFDPQREKQRLQQLANARRQKCEQELPAGDVAANLALQVPNNSYAAKPLYYVDKPFICRDCGRAEVWSARQQKWFYEVAKGSLYATAVRCAKCRRLHAERHKGRGDPNPIKHLGSLMKRIRKAIEPFLFAAGFSLEGMQYGKNALPAWLDYVRPGLILRCLYQQHHARMIAETVDDAGTYQVVANAVFGGQFTSAQLTERIQEFVATLREYVRVIRQ
jgi:Probable zinc-ribbon domain